MRPLLTQALLTGLLCAGFALAVDAVSVMFDTVGVAGISFVSGFLGSLVAQTLMRGTGRGKGNG